MGKKGKIKLILPKNSGNKKLFDSVINIVFKNNHAISTNDFKDHMELIMIDADVGFDNTSVIHKAVMPRYFGLLELRKNWLYLTEFGINYARSESETQKIDILFDAIESTSFGRDNNAVSSDSDINPPIVFLKMLNDLQSFTISQFGCLLYYLEVQELDYQSAIRKIKNKNNIEISLEKEKIKEEGGGKLFDPKFHILFQSLGLIEIIPDTKTYRLTDYVKNKYRKLIDDFLTSEIEETKEQSLDFQQNDKGKTTTSKTISDFNKEFDKQSKFTEPFIYLQKQSLPSKNKSLKKINIGANIKKYNFSDQDKFQIGWRGEKYFNNLLLSKSKLIFEELKFLKNENLESTNWFNEGFEKHRDWLDKSIGKGYDIEVRTNLRVIKIEVKTSWDNINYYTVTSNELKSMKENESDYFLVKINKLYNTISDTTKPKLTVINNPFSLLCNINSIKTITFYTTN